LPLIDTNILVRYFTRDEPELAARASQVLDEIESGDREATLTEAVIIETVNVLVSKQLYAVARSRIRDMMVGIILLPGILLSTKTLYTRALDVFVTYQSLSFVDSLLVSYAELEDLPTIISFDRGFRRVASITVEPR
jgi:predicted nucleic acid-binding protein